MIGLLKKRLSSVIVLAIGITLFGIFVSIWYRRERLPIVTLTIDSIDSDLTTLVISNNNSFFVVMEPVTFANPDSVQSESIVAPRDAISVQVPRTWTNETGHYKMMCRKEKTSVGQSIRSLFNFGRNRSKLVVFQPKELGWPVFSDAVPSNSVSPKSTATNSR